MTNKVFALAVLGLLACGCATHEENEQAGIYGSRQEGNIDARPGRDTNEPYTPVIGDTTGDGMPRDRRTGGAVTGTDVTPAERVNNNDKTRTNDGGAGAQSGGGVTPR
jgi:hypothetical protein